MTAAHRSTDIANASLYAETAGGGIYIEETVGDLPVDQILAGVGSDVSLSAGGTIKIGRAGSEASGIPGVNVGELFDGLVEGGAITLVSESGGVGEASRPLQLDSGDERSDKVNISAGLAGIYFDEIGGDLRVETISTTGDVVIGVLAGDLLDANRVEQVDDRAIEALRAGVWGSLQLTAALGATDKIDETLDAFASAKSQQYRTYWQFRNTQPDPSVYDAGFRVALTPDELVAYTDLFTQQGMDDGLTGPALDAAQPGTHRLSHRHFAHHATPPVGRALRTRR